MEKMKELDQRLDRIQARIEIVHAYQLYGKVCRTCAGCDEGGYLCGKCTVSEDGPSSWTPTL